jgi:TonB family protein
LKNYKFLLLTVCVALTSCSLFLFTPSAVVRKLIANAESGDAAGALRLWSRKSIQEQGLGKMKTSAQVFVDRIHKAREDGENLRIEKLRETINGDRARVFLLYRDAGGSDSMAMGFALIKEDGSWKLYRGIDVGEEELPFEKSFADNSERQNPSPENTTSPVALPPPPAPNTNEHADPTSRANTLTVSGGVLNGKAISLPQPIYPPVAKAAKASGTVVVQVTLDEDGKVISALAVSGHPLLRKAAEAAARLARFNPTKMGGKAVKVSGILNYEFSPQ